MKKWSLIAVALVIVGAVVCLASAANMQFDFGKLDSGNYETNTYAVDERFRSISVDATAEKVSFLPAKDGKCTVVCLEEEHEKHEVGVIDETLTIKRIDKRDPGFHFGLVTRSPEITVYLPERAYSDLRVGTDTGDVNLPAAFSFDRIAISGDTADVSCLASAKNGIEIALSTGEISLADVTAGSVTLQTTSGGIRAESVICEGDLQIRVDTGKVQLRDVRCKTLTSEGSTGEITLDHVVAADTVSITRSTGDVEFRESDAAVILVQTDAGDVTGSLLTEKVFLTETDTGDVEVPKSISGGRCEIRTDTGDIEIEVR